MKETVLKIIDGYLKVYPLELKRQQKLIDYVNKTDSNDLIDWNNFNGHIVASGFIYAKKEDKYLVIYHNDLKMFSYPGGHIDKSDQSPLAAAIREIDEETGIVDIKEVIIGNDKLIPIDIDTHTICYNKRLDIPAHTHYDMRYLFTVEKIEDVLIDSSESSSYKWISKEELMKNADFGNVVNKITM